MSSARLRHAVLGALGLIGFAAGAPHALAAGAPAAAADAGALEEVTVSARRRDETLQTTPVAVSAVTPSQLEDKATVNIGDLQGAVPNILITQQNSGAAAANLSIRGLTFADIEKSFDPTVAVVVDGVFLGTSTGQFFDFFDIQQLEVLRGPQGTLFGRNTIGGVINITRTKPTQEWGGKFDLSYGNYGTGTARAVLNVPIIEGVLGAKLWYFDHRTDGYYYNATQNRRTGWDHDKNYGASFLWTPKDTGFEAQLTLEKQDQKFDTVNSAISNAGDLLCNPALPFITPVLGLPAIGPVPANECGRNTKGDLYTVFGEPTGGTYRAPAATLALNFNTGGVHWTSVTGYRKSDEDQTQDFDSTSVDFYWTHRIQKFHQFSQEIRASGKATDSLDYVVGAYYYDHKYELTQFTRFGSVLIPVPQIVSGESKSTAAFADFDWQFAPQWRVNFGGRFTKDKKSLDNFLGAPLGSPSKSFSKFTPKVGIDWRPNEDAMIYASFSRGYRSGGFSNRAQTVFSTNKPFDPETVDSVELGAKTEWFDRRMSFNIAVFNAKYKNLQQNTTIPVDPVANPGSTGNETIVTNVGSATIRGVEAELVAKPTSQLTLNAAIGTLNSHFSGFITQAPVNGVTTNFDYSENNLIYNPKFTGSIGADYTIPTSFGDVHANVNLRHIAKYDQQISVGPTTVAADGTVIVHGNDPRVVAASQDLLDASLTTNFRVGPGKAKFTIYGRNLTDDRGPTAAFTVAGLFSFASAREPRTFGATIGYEF
jgi:iron complex outermembrane receptor protein